MKSVIVSRYNSPCGQLLLGSYADRLCMCDWMYDDVFRLATARLSRCLTSEIAEGESDVNKRAAEQLDAYFASGRREFDMPLLLVGTEFQKQVWEALAAIPFGSTVSYSAIASRIGRPKAVRAVATAIGANPLSIFLPCHRVIGRDGTLTGFAGGLEAKQFLLRLEGIDIQRT